MDHSVFMEAICKKLQELPPERKDAWITEQAKMVLEPEQQDFIMSLSGEKKVIYMPTEREIEEFCQAVQSGEIFVEYETHYYEFDSDGRYMDDWETQYNDPQGAFPFLDRVFRGCRELLRLGEHHLARKILDVACSLEFQVAEAENSEDMVDFADHPLFTIADAAGERKFSMDIREIGHDWLEALLLDGRDEESPEFAEEILAVLQSETGAKIDPGDFDGLITAKLLNYMEEILEKDIKELVAELEKFSGGREHWQKQYALETKMARKRHILLDIRKRCMDQAKPVKGADKAVGLSESWKQISELMRTLDYEKHDGGRLETEEVRKICQALMQRGNFGEEDWELRKEILRKMVSAGYYGRHGCYEEVKELAEKLYITSEETLEYADLLNENVRYEREAADLYRQYGKTDKYVRYLEIHLGKSSKEYVELIRYYCEAGNKNAARGAAEQGLKQCKGDLTELFIFLLRDAKERKDEERYKKLYASAKRRKGADIVRVDAGVRGMAL